MSSPSSMDPSSFAWSYGTIVSITNANGTPGNTITALGATWDATAQNTTNNNFRVLSDKVNAIIAVLQSNGTLT